MARPWVVLFLALAAARPSLVARAVPGVVHVRAVVERANGSFLPNLRAEDFVVSSDDTVRQVETLSSLDEPTTVLLLVDVTASAVLGSQMLDSHGVASHGHNPTAVVRGIEQEFIPHLGAGDRAQIGSFGRRLFVRPGFTADPRELGAASRSVFDLDPQERVGPSPIWDVTAEAAGALASEPGRRAVILISDGEASGNVRGMADAALEAVERGVSVNVILEDMRIGDVAKGPGDRLLKELADRTGGLFRRQEMTWFGQPGWNNEPPPFAQILRGLHQAYTLGFRVDDMDGRVHKLEVGLKQPRGDVRAPKFYIAR